MTGTSQVTDLIQVATRLIDILERESALLRAMKPSGLEALQQDKIALTSAYEAQVKALKANPQAAKSMPSDLRAELNAALRRFQAALCENARTLRAAKDATQSALSAIADEVQRQVGKHAGYSAQGMAAPPSASSGCSAMSFAVDQRL